MASASVEDVPIPGSTAVARPADDGAAVEVRCGDPSCRKLLFKLRQSDGVGITVERLCPGLHQDVTCALRNVGVVTGLPGSPIAGGLPSVWRCTQCDRYLAGVRPVKGRVTVLCRCGAEARVTAAHAIRATQPLARAS